MVKNKVDFLKDLRDNKDKDSEKNKEKIQSQEITENIIYEEGEFIEQQNNTNTNSTKHNNQQHLIQNDFFINVLVKDKKFKIFCGDGNQKLRWLSDVAIFKYESYNESLCGLAYSIKLENGSLCDLNDSINMVLHNNENVWVLLKEEYEVYQEDLMKKFSNENLYNKNSNYK